MEHNEKKSSTRGDNNFNRPHSSAQKQSQKKAATQKNNQAIKKKLSNVSKAGRIINRVKRTMQTLNRQLDDATSSQDIDDEYKPSSSIGKIIAFFIFLVAVCMCGYKNVSPGATESYRESQAYGFGSAIYLKFMKNGYHTVTEVLEEGYDGLEGYDPAEPNAATSRLYVKLTDACLSDVFRNTCQEIAKEYSHSLIYKLFAKTLDRDDERTLEEFRSQRYPYCKVKADGTYWTIGDFLDGIIPSKDNSDGIDYLNNDINYAEIISVLCLNPGFDVQSDTCTLEDFAELLTGANAKKLLYEMKISDPYYESYEYLYNEDGTAVLNEYGLPVKGWVDKGQTYPEDADDSDVKYYYTFEIMPYGLRELYALADVDPTETHPVFDSFSNYEMMDKKEEYLRYFAGSANSTLGIDYRDERPSSSILYNAMIAQNGYASGRSLFYYIKDASNIEDIPLAEWDEKDLPDVTPSYTYSEEKTILPMPQYINQGNYLTKRGSSSTTIKSSGCIDCSYAMIVAYYKNITIDIAQVAQTSRYYTGSNFVRANFLADYQMNSSQDYNHSFDVNAIREEIKKGHPVVFHIRGIWNYNGKNYHGTTNGHFLVIMGYDQQGFYFYDPGKKSNVGVPIPYDAFDHVSDKYYRIPLG